jgi:hypothetical protein
LRFHNNKAEHNKSSKDEFLKTKSKKRYSGGRGEQYRDRRTKNREKTEQ